MTVDDLKREAASRALKYVRSDMNIGLGTGSTARWAVILLGEKLARGELRNVSAVPTSSQTERLMREQGVPLIELAADGLDLAIDGADEVDPQLNLIKGRGGALLREKIVEAAAGKFIVIADDSKKVNFLGQKHPLPIEIAKFGWRRTLSAISRLALSAELREGERGPLLSDNGNYIVDAAFGAIEQPKELEKKLLLLPGVLEVGLFLGMADLAIIAGMNGVEEVSL